MTAYVTVNYTPFGTKELTLDELDQVTGGTFTRNKYSKSTYHALGISTSYNFFAKDEFMFMGRKISYDEANELAGLAEMVFNILNEGNEGANRIGYNEPAFIRAYNSQLKLKYGFQWNGVPGTDF